MGKTIGMSELNVYNMLAKYGISMAFAMAAENSVSIIENLRVLQINYGNATYTIIDTIENRCICFVESN